MLFEMAMSVEIVKILEKQQFYPKILDFMQEHHSVATLVHVNLPKKPIITINYRNSALDIVIMVV